MHKDPTIAIVACEESGDYLGSELIKELRKIFPHAKFIGVGGLYMQKQGVQSMFKLEELTAHGIFEIIHRIPRLLSIMRSMRNKMLEVKPDVFIGIDAPDFNLNLEKMLLSKGINTVHYISPTIWSWRPKRVFKVAKAVRLLLCTYPFEVDIYKKCNSEHGLNINAQYIGHPLADEIPLQNPSKEAARKKLGINHSNNIKYIGVLPGSRSTEIKSLSQIFIDSVHLCLQQDKQLQFIFAAINDKAAEHINQLIQESELPLSNTKIFVRRSHDIMAAADAILLASGTATLEAMLIKRPMVVAYKVPMPTYWVSKLMIKTKFISQPNLMFGREMVKELVQYDAKPKPIAKELMQQLNTPFSSKEKEYTEMHKKLKLNASLKAAQQIAQLIK
ncbi:MAG: lipid-A-disaccharide synthase [Candidatus Portiera sp.]|nr:lipid-A-disaccharide synthase [Portiera sp.]